MAKDPVSSTAPEPDLCDDLEDDLDDAAGIDDPLVCTFVAPRGCDECRRVWGTPRDLKTYPLSFVKARDAMGGNHHLPREAWGPVTGPVHPGCTCAGYSVYDAKLVAAINDAADEILARYRR